jgi:hypothetical protein
MPLIETALGLENAFVIASADRRVSALLLGAEDLTADLRAPRTSEGVEIAYARGRIVCAARAAGVDVFDTPFTDVNDMEGIRRDALFARALGFTGKAVISPRHVDLVNEIFSPREKEIEYAFRVFDAIENARKQGKGAAGGGKAAPAPEPGLFERTADNVSGWFRRQIDEEQTVRVAGPLVPGKRLRLQIHQGVFGESHTIELALPPEFEPGRPIRLKGMGKRIGKWHGDLYLRITN